VIGGDDAELKHPTAVSEPPWVDSDHHRMASPWVMTLLIVDAFEG